MCEAESSGNGETLAMPTALTTNLQTTDMVHVVHQQPHFIQDNLRINTYWYVFMYKPIILHTECLLG